MKATLVQVAAAATSFAAGLLFWMLWSAIDIQIAKESMMQQIAEAQSKQGRAEANFRKYESERAEAIKSFDTWKRGRSPNNRKVSIPASRYAPRSYWEYDPSAYGYFIGQLRAEFLDAPGDLVVLLSDYAFIDPQHRAWDVPRGFQTDGASIPQLFKSFTGGNWDGRYRNAAVVHDFYCEYWKYFDRPDFKVQWREVHKMFYYGMRANGVSEDKAKLMFGAVWHFGPRWSSTERPSHGVLNEGQIAQLRDFIEEKNRTLEEIETHPIGDKIVRRPSECFEKGILRHCK